MNANDILEILSDLLTDKTKAQDRLAEYFGQYADGVWSIEDVERIGKEDFHVHVGEMAAKHILGELDTNVSKEAIDNQIADAIEALIDEDSPSLQPLTAEEVYELDSDSYEFDPEAPETRDLIAVILDLDYDTKATIGVVNEVIDRIKEISHFEMTDRRYIDLAIKHVMSSK